MNSKLVVILFPIIFVVFLVLFLMPALQHDRHAFTLDGANGKVSLADFKGKVVAVYFGYASCPDICPTSLSTMASAMKRLLKEEAEQVQVVFISVDPERDTPAMLEEYAKYFYPTFTGVTGTPEAIKEVASRYEGTHYARLDDNGSAMGYSVGHTSFFYFFDRHGNFSSRQDHSMNPDATAEHLRKALAR